ncbi:hypothetical protein C8J57DRAFT_1514872 [Mycena rebaudengoi]|nr:hypothetical protein C8J57DRAFT_1514872 [Mycena rebaudengoi]
MAQTAATQTTASAPSVEMETFVAKVAALSKLAVDLTKLAIEVQTELPRIVHLQMGAVSEDDNDDYLWAAGTPLTPDEMEAKIPPGVGENQTWYVVLRGRNPGLYPSYLDSDAQVLGVPNQFRQKKCGRTEALTFYRYHFTRGDVEKWTEVDNA